MEPLILQLLHQSEQQVHLCVSFILLWIASSDGDIHQSEREFLFKHMETTNRGSYEKLNSIIEKQDFKSFLLVCKLLKDNLDDSMRESLLVISIDIAIADQRLAISEIHLLRLLADMMNYSPVRFSSLYTEVTGAKFPDPGDPSSMQWWQSKQSSNQKKTDDSGQKHQRSPRNHSGISREEAHVILGLQAGSSQDDIRRAYKRLVQAHHPDRFSSLGPDAADAAHSMFVRIQEAYKVLSR